MILEEKIYYTFQSAKHRACLKWKQTWHKSVHWLCVIDRVDSFVLCELHVCIISDLCLCTPAQHEYRVYGLRVGIHSVVLWSITERSCTEMGGAAVCLTVNTCNTPHVCDALFILNIRGIHPILFFCCNGQYKDVRIWTESIGINSIKYEIDVAFLTLLCVLSCDITAEYSKLVYQWSSLMFPHKQ